MTELTGKKGGKPVVLIADDSEVILSLVSSYFKTANFDVITACDGEEAIAILDKSSQDIDLLVTDINMPNKDGFDLISHIRLNEINVPFIVITTEDVNEYLDLAVTFGVGNILCKPVQKDELLNLSYKILTGENFFGLENYLLDNLEIFTAKINSSESQQEQLAKFESYLFDQGMEGGNASGLMVLCSEMMVNALYHSHGFTEEKEKRERIVLPDNQFIEFKYGRNVDQVGFGITDFNGKLSRYQILSKFQDLVLLNKQIEDMTKGKFTGELVLEESGRGISMIRGMADKYYFNIKKEVKTEVIVVSSITPDENAMDKDNFPISISEIM